MSINALMWAKRRKVSGPGAKLVLLLLADRANDDTSTCWPSIALLAAEACMSERQVRRHIEEMAAGGLIAVEQRRDDRRRNLYRLLIASADRAIMIPDHMSSIPNPPSTNPAACGEMADTMSAISGEAGYRTDATGIPDTGDGNSGHSARVSGTQTNPKEPSFSAQGAGEREAGRKGDEEHAEETFADLMARYGVTAEMQISRARELWRRLSRSERKAALSAVGEYLESRKAAGRAMPVDIANWIGRRAWVDVAEARKLRKATEAGAATNGFLAGEGSQQWQAWLVYYRCRGMLSIPEYLIERHEAGRMLRTREEWPVVGRGLDPDMGGWMLVERGTQQFAAWMGRLREGGGGAISTQTVNRDGVSTVALRVPQEWPPSKKLNDDEQADAATGDAA